MSYDLELRAPGLYVALGRLGYRLRGSQVLLVDEATGVPVVMDLDREVERATLRVPMPRISTYGQVAAHQVSRLAPQVPGLRVRDPQVDGEHVGAWDEAAFLRGWDRANRSAHQDRDPPLEGQRYARRPVSPRRVQDFGAWNLAQRLLQLSSFSAFVPNLFFGLVQGRVRTYVVWGDAMATWLPRVDFVVVARNELRVGPSGGGLESCVVSAQALELALAGLPWVEGPLPYRVIEPEPGLEAWVRSLPTAAPGSFSGVGLEELFEAPDETQALGPP